ncbi:hypothetical protein QFZ99_006397 [Paraburkholderia atlantica]|uniref:phytanoyl-CoA dioxygenase family protein n=1 Tax=Paraburkholderia atlantica TaxID=2654982 RepID=UPI003D1CA9CF
MTTQRRSNAIAATADRRAGDRGARRKPALHHAAVQGVFADQSIFCESDVLGIVERVAGDDPVMCQLATDTPLNGSTYQEIHRDTPALFDGEAETPSFHLAVNFPLCDVTLENGPLETTLGTHRMRSEDARLSTIGATRETPAAPYAARKRTRRCVCAGAIPEIRLLKKAFSHRIGRATNYRESESPIDAQLHRIASDTRFDI